MTESRFFVFCEPYEANQNNVNLHCTWVVHETPNSPFFVRSKSTSFIWVSNGKRRVLHTVWCNISGEAAGKIWNWSLLGVKGLNVRQSGSICLSSLWRITVIGLSVVLLSLLSLIPRGNYVTNQHSAQTPTQKMWAPLIRSSLWLYRVFSFGFQVSFEKRSFIILFTMALFSI